MEEDRADADWAALWLATRIRVRGLGPGARRTVDIDTPAAGQLARALSPLPLPFALVTAWNPAGLPTGLVANRRANQRLRDQINSEGWRCWPATGTSADGSWAEPGFAIGGLTEHQAIELGVAFGQLAVFLVSDPWVLVLGCDRRLRLVRARGDHGAKR